MLVGVPALIELSAVRIVVALSMSVLFLVIQHEYNPYATAEHNMQVLSSVSRLLLSLVLSE